MGTREQLEISQPRLIVAGYTAGDEAACPKPVGAAVVELGPDLAGVDWESLVARSWVDGRLYQEGPLSVLRRPADPVVGCSNSRPASRT
ncbi:DUF2848 family protein [Embleya sp. NPDC059259]|uniref:DUF2848 family protein n=1 Tax=unclassified Embleya TaxID=2699296 RepID=UPI0036740E8A